jgi:hypothetical protein
VASCPSGTRELAIANNSSQPVWVSGGGGALRSICVINGGASSCLPATFNSNGTCTCGSTSGALACPGTASASGSGTQGGKNCYCTANSDCGPGAGCNLNTNLCYYTLPEPTAFSGFTPSNPWNWELPAKGNTASFCLAQGSVSYNGGTNNLPSAVWWSGGVFARTGCKPDGTSCQSGDCNTFFKPAPSATPTSAPNSNCPVGVGASNPVTTLAEFTLQATDNDFYDISDINGANIGEQMAPLPTATQTPGAVTPYYWCSTPGGNCAFNYGDYAKAVPMATPTDASPLLMLVSQGCTAQNNPALAGQCPSGFACNGSSGATNGVCWRQCTSSSQCPGTEQCRKAQDGNSYCQCSQQSDCPAGQFCGSQLIPGIGVIQQQCGNFQGWWTADTLCGQTSSVIGDPSNPTLNCTAALTNGLSGTTTLTQLLQCVGANATSCYNSAAANANCCGCGTSNANPLFPDWNLPAGENCGSNNPTWASNGQPWLDNLKKACSSAYSYPFDDATSTFQCRAQGSTNLLGYVVTFTDLPVPTSQ